MENKRPSKKSSKQGPHSLAWMRALALRQWRHADPVPDPNRNVHEASEHVDALLKKIGVTGGMDEKRLRDAWGKVAGDFIAKHCEPESLKNGVLVLKVVQPAMRFHLEQMKGKLLSNLRKELGRDVVKMVRFKVG